MNQEIAQVTKIAIFRNRKIRKTIHKNEWWFVITDVIVALTDSQNPKQYLKNMLNRDDELAKGWVQIEHLLLIEIFLMLEIENNTLKMKRNCFSI